jgi:hypothetical protein
MIKGCILADRLYVPEEHVSQEVLDEFVYTIEEDEAYDYGPFVSVVGSIRTFAKVRLNGEMYYGFSRGNVPKIGRLFGHLPWEDKTAAPKMKSNLKFKGSLYNWKDNHIGQEEATKEWLQCRGGIIKAPPRFGKCCSGDTIIHTETQGSIPIKDLFSLDHIDGEVIPSVVNLATKEGIASTSGLYKKTVDKTIVVTTRRGFSIEVTPNHPLYVKKERDSFEWKNTADIKIGDRIAIFAGTNVFTEKQSSHYALYAKYVKLDKKYSEQVVLRMMRLGKATQLLFLKELGSEINLNNKKTLKLLQIMVLNLGYLSRIEN